MGGDAFVVVFFKPEISTGFFKFTSSANDSESDATPSTEPSSSIPGVSAVEAAFLLPNGHIIPTVLSRINDKGFETIQRRMHQLTKAEARHLFTYEQQYRFKDDPESFAAYLNSITSGPSLALVLKLPAALALGDANAAIKKWVELAGDWDPVVARKKALAASTPHDQWPLRALCGLNTVQNGISSSPHVCCSRRERYFLMPPPVPQLERATIVLFPSFYTNFPDAKETLFSTIGREAQAIVVENYESCSLSDDQVIALCGVTLTSGSAQTCESVVQLARETAGSKGVDVIVLEGLDLTYTLRFAVGPANVELAKFYFPESVRARVVSKLPSVELPLELHPNETADDDALGFESGLFVSFDPKLSIRNTTEPIFDKGTPVESTLGLIKPNAACKPEVVTEILRMTNVFGFKVERQRRLLLSRDQAGAFYAEHRGKVFFNTLLEFMTSGEIVVLHLARTHAIKAWRGLMGPINSMTARETHPWTLRARFGVDGTRNATHGSDSSTSAARELCFFFGSAVTASTSTQTAPLKAQAVAQRPIASSGISDTSVEKILTLGLKELVEKNLSDPLEACRWLGEWLVSYRSRGLEEGSEMYNTSDSARRPKATTVKRVVDGENTLKAHKVVAITLDTSVNSLRNALLDTFRKKLEKNRYGVVDVASELEKHTAPDVAVANLVKTLTRCGRRRCVLFGCEDFASNSVFHNEFKTQAPAEWQINFIVRLDLENSAGVITQTSPLFEVPVLHFNIPSKTQEIEKAGVLHGLFQAVFDPNIIILVDPEKLFPVIVWTQLATQFGFNLVTFEDVITLLTNSNDNSDDTRLLLELLRSGSKVSSTLILTAIRRVIFGLLPGSNTFGQKFMLLGFPWPDIQLAELEQTVGRPQSLLYIGQKKLRFKATASSLELPAWVTVFRKKGLVRQVWIDSTVSVDRVAAYAALQNVALPVIGCYLGECDGLEQFGCLRIAARTQGFLWIDCATVTPSVQKLRELLLRAQAGREKFLLYGYPQTSAQAAEFLNLVGRPRFVIHNSSASPVAPELLAAFDAHPDISQLDLASSNGPSKLRSIFFSKQVVALVGSVDTLHLPQLRDVVAPLGYDVIEFKHDHVLHDEDEQIRGLERQVQAVQAPRCLVIGAPASPSFYHALEARIGCSMHQILILQHVKVRVRDPAMDDEDSAGDSDEEQGHVLINDSGSDGDDTAKPAIRWRKVFQALSPQLSQLVKSFASASKSSISIDVVGFLENAPRGSSRVVQDVVARLRPRFFGVVGHRFSFYQTVARGFCRRHLAGFLDLTNVSSNNEALQQVATLIQTTPHSSYCLDGFPRSSLPDDSVSSTPRYVAQQLWELDRRLGKMNMLVRFTATLEMLEERTPKQVTRRMLDLAQDDLEQTSADLVRWFKTGKSHQTITEVTCDRTVESAQKEMDDVLQWTLRPSRPSIN
ncbi:Nucleoside diphosphate kinase domain-containing protein [Phytophthora infestans]|uniref:Nucleoside diphosphate kinase domain-containing protein n=1 Tax=Phytophthora infestans TaxID=4787 RepID=A0A833SKT3_PHYIN|nr:Nucleoside diphosphate kinase domain-containing protein [Phytophthora infestans]KAF4150600.1 Nucleoside diphosphate kinase domain-containing protein [Phytophthora infestans]